MTKMLISATVDVEYEFDFDINKTDAEIKEIISKLGLSEDIRDTIDKDRKATNISVAIDEVVLQNIAA